MQTLHSLFYLETALHVSVGTITHHQERKQLYLQYLAFVTPYCYLPLSWKSWNWLECAVGGVRHPQHTQTKQQMGFNSGFKGLKQIGEYIYCLL